MVANMDSSVYVELLPRSAKDKGHGCSGTGLPAQLLCQQEITSTDPPRS